MSCDLVYYILATITQEDLVQCLYNLYVTLSHLRSKEPPRLHFVLGSDYIDVEAEINYGDRVRVTTLKMYCIGGKFRWAKRSWISRFCQKPRKFPANATASCDFRINLMCHISQVV